MKLFLKSHFSGNTFCATENMVNVSVCLLKNNNRLQYNWFVSHKLLIKYTFVDTGQKIWSQQTKEFPSAQHVMNECNEWHKIDKTNVMKICI